MTTVLVAQEDGVNQTANGFGTLRVEIVLLVKETLRRTMMARRFARISVSG